MKAALTLYLIMKKVSFLLFTAVLFVQSFQTAYAQSQEMAEAEMIARMTFVLDSIEKSFQWQTGKVDLPGGMASINVPANLRYLNPEQSAFVLSDVWGNPPGVSTAGMLFPVNTSPLTDSAWAFNLSFEEMGYVKDGDADDIDYNELLDNMKKEAVEASKERTQQGYEAIDIVGWASSPYYDKDKKVLHWAKEIKFGTGEAGNTLNYDMRFLGRKGVLSLNAISGINQLELVKGNVAAITNAVSFNEGHRYEDFDSNVDEVAAWTLGGLVAGKVLAKAGFFAVILKFIKPILIGGAALATAIWRWFTGRQQKDEGAE
jgi:uncharacterized membrane-anchored protein